MKKLLLLLLVVLVSSSDGFKTIDFIEPEKRITVDSKTEMCVKKNIYRKSN